MEKSEMILGYAEYDGSEYPFVYEKGKLILLPPTESEWGVQRKDLIENMAKPFKTDTTHRFIENLYIVGITSKNKNIIFISTGTVGNNNGFREFEIKVIYEYQSNSPNGDLISGLTIKAEEIDYFFNPARVFESKIFISDDNKLDTISIKSGKNFNDIKDCGTYTNENMSISIEISAYSTYSSQSEKPLSAQSQICFEFDQPVSLDKTIEVINHQVSFLKYVCYRENINLKSIDVIRRNEKDLRVKEGNIIIVDSYINETNKKKSDQILNFELLEGNVTSLFQSIADGEVYLSHICENINSRKSYDIARIILLFTAFEAEYENFFSSDTLRSPKYFEAQKEALDLLNNFKDKSNSRSKSYIRSFINSITFNDVPLNLCIKNVIEKNKDLIEIFLNYNYRSCDKELINSIAERLSTMRNHIAHGNLTFKIEAIHIFDLKILEILIYIMRLSSLEISDESIQKGVCNLMGYNIAIQDSPKKEKKV